MFTYSFICLKSINSLLGGGMFKYLTIKGTEVYQVNMDVRLFHNNGENKKKSK